MHSYTFLEVQAPATEFRPWRESVKSLSEPKINCIRYPVFVLDHDLLLMMDKHGVFDKFEIALNRLAQTCSHDFGHHYFFPSVDELGIDRELTRIVRSLCANIESPRQQKNIETLAIMLNLAGYLQTKDSNAENVYAVSKAFMAVRDELCAKLEDTKEVEAVRLVFNSIAVLLVSGFVQKEDLMRNVDGDISDWLDLLKNPKHIFTPDTPIFMGYRDPDAVRELVRRERQVPSDQIIKQIPADIALDMIRRYEELGKSLER